MEDNTWFKSTPYEVKSPTQKQIYQRKRALFKGSLRLILENCNDFIMFKHYSSWWERYKIRQIIHFAESLLRKYKCQK